MDRRLLGFLGGKFGLDLEPRDLEAAYSLANAHWTSETTQPLALRYVDLALKALPNALRTQPDVDRFVGPIVGLLAEIVGTVDEPFALAAAWTDGTVRRTATVHLSTVDVHKIGSVSRLVTFLRDPAVLSCGVVSDMPTDEPTRLQLLLSPAPSSARRIEPSHRAAVAQPDLAGAPVSRSAPCPCGSGRKYKKCCAV